MKQLSAKDLRIGNLINDPYGAIVAVNIELLRYILNQYNHKYKPIELTEEWLIKAGFQNFGKKGIYDIAISVIGYGYLITFRLMKNEAGFDFIIDQGTGSGTRVGINLGTRKHLHSLQNFYRDLTNGELNIKI